MKSTTRWCLIAITFLSMVGFGGTGYAQLDGRFGVSGVEGTTHLGAYGPTWYRDWNESCLTYNYPAPGRNKIWTVGKIDYRSDHLGTDWQWILLELLEDRDINLMDSFLNLCLALVNNTLMPMIDDYWTVNKPILEETLSDTLDNFSLTEVKYGIKYRATAKNTDIVFQDELPDFQFSVADDVISFNTNIVVDWKTHLYIKAWVLNPNPFNWGYFWKGIGDADCKFKTTVKLTGKIVLDGIGRERHLRVAQIKTASKTESSIDWSLLGISFTWDGLSNSVEDLIDGQLEKTMTKELNKEPITTPYYFADYFKDLFDNGYVPSQQELLDNIFRIEQNFIHDVIQRSGYTRQYWTIGYEPNWFPALEPEQYAAEFVRYYRFIKQLDPRAKVLGPSLFLTEAIENPGEIAWSLIPRLFLGLLGDISDEFRAFIETYYNKADSKSWHTQFIDALPPDVKIDVNDFHIFPMTSEGTAINMEELSILMDDMAEFMRTHSGANDVWVSGCGNIDWRRSETQAAEVCAQLCEYFKTNSVGIKKWFWYRSYGHGPVYDLPVMPTPAKSALLKNDYSLTRVGQVFLQQADNTAPIITAAPAGQISPENPSQGNFSWNEAKEFDTGISDYQLQVKISPGNFIVYDKWVGAQLSYSLISNVTTTLYARIRAQNGAGLLSEWSDWSEGIKIRKVPPVADNLSTDPLTEVPSASDNSAVEAGLSKSNAHAELPVDFKVSDNYPNPFNPTTSIDYQLPVASHVKMVIFNTRGQLITTLINTENDAGFYTIQWDGRDDLGQLAVSGMYFCRISIGEYHVVRKMVMVQ
ncbi:T9SS type A sorting domain-containing protein [candidate division KSB1 bacterium]|nr:T9SS type A sorting domain-containing protein [candidate division KSB1 bacterium]